MRPPIAGIGVLLARTFGVLQAGFFLRFAMMDGAFAAGVIFVRHEKSYYGQPATTTAPERFRSVSRRW
jgi:hypothetical protein